MEVQIVILQPDKIFFIIRCCIMAALFFERFLQLLS